MQIDKKLGAQSLKIFNYEAFFNVRDFTVIFKML